ncbi:molybdopterin-synthase adenylyltransferase MoeB [Reichenbachiella carrageenanivorans]|uniref:Molybdopterin-synthase adenylyltransferase MoeB n=1 Tax=Reichenbachiella carrageenanivorans TaxID=2979869 RepID=A0ABY6CYM3_9BACT|nr:molybdopterin-synthase adenylyltransferase MoeB [Reichenbachiella carrageenanivorans]UXX78968.1 molybdopterin-synthase adenylyltransferase MoeB [Reichenbachiella carrageenanivorans]
MSEVKFSKEELERYSRHLIIPEFNIEGQRKLKEAKVLVVGTGGLGSPLLLYLTAAGVGNIGILDFDVVDDSNLQRQVLFTVDDVGKPKAVAAKARLEKLNPHVNFTVHNEMLTSQNALDIVKDYDVVADGTDNFPTRYLVNDACVILDKVNVYASIFRFEGQVSVFNFKNKEGENGPHYRDLFPTPPPPGLVPSCAEGGVIGVLPGIIGTLQANEVLKVISGIGEPLAGRLFLFDALTFETRTMKIHKNKNTIAVTELIDYEIFCGLNEKEKEHEVNEITVEELSKWKATKKDFQLIDVREAYEYEIANLEGELIPLGEITDHVNQIRSDVEVVLHCRSGKRSADAIVALEKLGFANLLNLKGGILAWADELDPEMAKY